jgi:hypothetical protein
MSKAERAALEYLADPTDPFCSPFEIVTVVQLWDGDLGDAAAMMERWQASGWVEVVPQSEPDGTAWLTLTEAGQQAVAAMRDAS